MPLEDVDTPHVPQPAPPRVFVSWAGSGSEGKDGEELSTCLTKVLDQPAYPSISIFHSATHIQSGEVVSERVLNELAIADYAIVVLEPEAISSTWVGFETGFMRARLAAQGRWPSGDAIRAGEIPPVFLLLMCSTPSLLRRTPFHQSLCAFVDKDGLDKLAMTVASWAGGELDAPALAAELRATVLPKWHALQSKERETNQELLRSRAALLMRYQTFGLAGKKRAKQIGELDDFARAFGRESAHPGTRIYHDLSAIASLLRQLRENDELFGASAEAWAMDQIRDTHRVLSEGVTSGRLKVGNRKATRGFYLRGVLGVAKAELWTTNFGHPGHTMGSAHEGELLEAHERACGRDVKITRVFVYPEAMDAEEVAERRAVMAAQISVGVTVYVIGAMKFHKAAKGRRLKLEVETDDFMLVDNKLLYLTYQTDEQSMDRTTDVASESELPEIEAELYQYAVKHEDLIEKAQRLRDAIQSAAKRVWKEDVGKFPDGFT